MPTPGEEIDLEGSAGEVAGSCPALTFRLQGVEVYTSNATEFKKGPCKDVTNGTLVRVEGHKMSDGRVRADKIELRSRGGGGDGDRIEAEGTASSISGSCPAVTFRVKDVTFYTSAATKFDDGKCADLKTGVSVEVKGRREADGRVHADEVEFDD